MEAIEKYRSNKKKKICNFILNYALFIMKMKNKIKKKINFYFYRFDDNNNTVHRTSMKRK